MPTYEHKDQHRMYIVIFKQKCKEYSYIINIIHQTSAYQVYIYVYKYTYKCQKKYRPMTYKLVATCNKNVSDPLG